MSSRSSSVSSSKSSSSSSSQDNGGTSPDQPPSQRSGFDSIDGESSKNKTGLHKGDDQQSHFDDDINTLNNLVGINQQDYDTNKGNRDALNYPPVLDTPMTQVSNRQGYVRQAQPVASSYAVAPIGKMKTNMEDNPILESQTMEPDEHTRQNSHQDSRDHLVAPKVEPIKAPQLTQAEKDKIMMENVLGTESLIDQMLSKFGRVEDEDLSGWNRQDPHFNPQSRANISYLKMKNEINYREARTKNSKGELVPISICGSTVGCHCSKRRCRKSEIDELGPGVGLYFKMLKFLSSLFFLFTILSIPSLAIFLSGESFLDSGLHPIVYWVTSTTMGSLNEFKTLECAHSQIESNSVTTAPNMKFRCQSGNDGQGYKISGFKHFGLAYKDRTCTGLGMDMSVNTLDRCSVGGMSDEFKENLIIQTFETACLGKQECEMPIDISTLFDTTCQQEIVRRQMGYLHYGALKLYGLAECEKEMVSILPQFSGTEEGFMQLSRENAAFAIVGCDILTLLIFTIGIFRLRWYETLVEKDRQLLQPHIEDFSVYLPNIPINSKAYEQNSELLTAMMAVHLEQTLCQSFIKDEKMTEEEADDLSQVSSIHYGLKSHHPMLYLVKISDSVREVSVLKKKMQYDPINAPIYEEQIWTLYTEVTRLKDKYYKTKGIQGDSGPSVLNAQVTFRDIQARNKVLQIYNMNPLKRCLVSCGCYEKQLRLLGKGTYSITHSVDPTIIQWENVGQSFTSKVSRCFKSYSIVFVIFAFTFFGFWTIQLFEKLQYHWRLSRCDGNDFYDIDSAFEDHLKPHTENQQQGLMECYCEQMYTTYGSNALGIMFEDGEQYCKEWYFSYFFTEYVGFILAAFIAVVNYIVQQVFEEIGKSRQTKNVSDNHIYRTLSVFLLQYFNMQAALMMSFMNFAQTDLKREQQNQTDFLVGPFDEYSIRWYLTVGVPILIAIFFQIFFPHIGLIFNSCKLGCLRCKDRSFTCNNRKTKQITQDEYEDLYTGPEQILQLRFAQLLGNIFTIMTYSMGMPILYFVGFLSMFISYWTDKVLVSKYFRKENGFTADLSRNVVNMLRWAIIVHMPIGYMMVSNPDLLSSSNIADRVEGYTVPEVSGNQYFSSTRLSQSHVILYICGCAFILLLIFFEQSIAGCCGFSIKISRIGCAKCSSCVKRAPYLPPKDENEEMIDAPDIYWEISFAQLVKEYKIQKTERQKYNQLKNLGQFNADHVRDYIDPYIKLVERNERDILFRIQQLTDMHMDRIPNFDSLQTNEEKIAAVRELYDQATNKDNPNRDQVKIEDALRGRISSHVMSYNLMDNPKYKLIEELNDAIEDTFGKLDSKKQMVQGLKRLKTFAASGNIQNASGDEIDMDDNSVQESAIQSQRSHQDGGTSRSVGSSVELSDASNHDINRSSAMNNRSSAMKSHNTSKQITESDGYF